MFHAKTHQTYSVLMWQAEFVSHKFFSQTKTSISVQQIISKNNYCLDN